MNTIGRATILAYGAGDLIGGFTINSERIGLRLGSIITAQQDGDGCAVGAEDHE